MAEQTPSDPTNQDAAAAEAQGHDDVGRTSTETAGRKVKETQGEYAQEQARGDHEVPTTPPA